MLSVKSIPAFNDNYIWLIHNNHNHCVVVDPGDATPVLECIKEHDFILDAILITHHHHDHIGGVPELVRQFPNVNVVGPENEPIPTLTHPVGDGDFVELFDEQFMVLGVPGHTNGHVAYIGDEKLFCGDALFSAGCGRLFEGTAEQMFNSLQKMAALPDETEVYCAHEYTASNLAFALAVEPDNDYLLRYREKVLHLRAHGKSTIPSTLQREKLINPFLRTSEANVKKSVASKVQDSTEVEIFTALRRWKDEF
ncbi:hydroxyacylglutathione hydrolase [Aliivibrio fischeri]|uniref:hydroxyacylglutathione hydrolase n=1 Tax=Aliivibrio fischeri TaxID=668 RepID=UPI0012D99384|nr:hydroxyacylglutathione hydrolase [Aliivibrio fischeri]MUK60318.1 hydroxyacylglutathione hydrolase [Aliivibrio fischeri]MUK71176.1 hydroxyacylglutathione hydrolase [Aliivibrio fischeri]MUK74177.1 hydroxyacylglutathione hydrolase [Aliivibrio fischeri]MUK75455.1 hydroxyacylglutathione hydrolase [Aliivibrio fischeri]MUL22886.1 hydroxyacylglutathione hydrolase [Aliivibrio fischeri]